MSDSITETPNIFALINYQGRFSSLSKWVTKEHHSWMLSAQLAASRTPTTPKPGHIVVPSCEHIHPWCTLKHLLSIHFCVEFKIWEQLCTITFLSNYKTTVQCLKVWAREGGEPGCIGHLLSARNNDILQVSNHRSLKCMLLHFAKRFIEKVKKLLNC